MHNKIIPIAIILFLFSAIVAIAPSPSSDYDFINNEADFIMWLMVFLPHISIGGNLTAENVWQPTYCFAHTHDTQNITGAGVWLNVSFDEQLSLCTHMTHTHSNSTNNTFTIQDAGTYDISYHMTFSDTAPAPNGHIEMRVTRNSSEIHGSLLEEDSSKQYNDFTLSNGILVNLDKDDEVRFQFTSDDTTVGMSSHALYGDHKDTGVIKIRRIS